jgi:hypothetical protein
MACGNVQIVAEALSEKMEFRSVNDVDKMLTATGALKPDAVQAFRNAGARAIVANTVPEEVARNGWQELAIAPWYVYILPQ